MKLRSLVDYSVVVLAAILITVFVQAYVVKPYRIPSKSMESTLLVGDRVLVDRLVYHFQEPQRGDVLVFEYPKDRDFVFIKRVVGVPGDTLVVRGGALYVNGRRADESHVHRTGGHTDATTAAGSIAGTTMRDPWSLATPYTVPAGCYFVMGDNRGDSDDSRVWGVVPRDAVIGEGRITYWPLNRLGTL